MFQINYSTTDLNSAEILTYLENEGALGSAQTALSDNQILIQAWFDEKKDLKISPGTWKKVDQDDWNHTTIANVSGAEIHCAADVFGNGAHATTQMCISILELVLTHFQNREGIRFADLGTGSGILSIFAWQNGVRDIFAIDLQESAIQQAIANAKQVGIPSTCFTTQDVADLNSDPKDIIVANLLSQILEEHLGTILSALAPQGYLILSGIGSQWDLDMRALFQAHDLKIGKRMIQNDWMSYLLTRA